MQPLTLNQIIQRLRTIAESHKQVNTFDHGFSVTDFIKSNDVVYPAVYAMISQPFSVSSASRLTSIPFVIIVMDLVSQKDGKDNETEVYSDSLLIAEDILALMNGYTTGDLPWVISDTNTGEFLYEDGEDSVAGVSLNIQIGWAFRNDRCSVPVNNS